MWEVYEFLARGGPIMIPIALGSVTALAILFERLWTLRRANIVPPKLLSDVLRLTRRGRVDQARERCTQSASPLGRTLDTCLKYRGLPRADIRTAVEDTGRREVTHMSRLIEALGAIAAISPLLGLLGTVTGMIQAFREVVEASDQGAIDPGGLANGIWEALITTAAGLSVAILAYLAYRYLNGRATRLAYEMEQGALELLDEVSGVDDQEGADEDDEDGEDEEEA